MERLKQKIKDASVYLVVLGAFWLTLNSKTNELKAEINTAVRVQCVSNAALPLIQKYNDSIQAQIDTQHAAYTINITAGETERAALNLSTAQRLKDDRIALPKQDCSVPLLK